MMDKRNGSMDTMSIGAMNSAFEAATQQFFALALTGAVYAILITMTACLMAGIMRRVR
jgi:hypothetical protein